VDIDSFIGFYPCPLLFFSPGPRSLSFSPSFIPVLALPLHEIVVSYLAACRGPPASTRWLIVLRLCAATAQANVSIRRAVGYNQEDAAAKFHSDDPIPIIVQSHEFPQVCGACDCLSRLSSIISLRNVKLSLPWSPADPAPLLTWPSLSISPSFVLLLSVLAPLLHEIVIAFFALRWLCRCPPASTRWLVYPTVCRPLCPFGGQHAHPPTRWMPSLSLSNVNSLSLRVSFPFPNSFSLSQGPLSLTPSLIPVPSLISCGAGSCCAFYATPYLIRSHSSACSFPPWNSGFIFGHVLLTPRVNSLTVSSFDCWQAAVSIRRVACSSSDQVNAAAISHGNDPISISVRVLESWLYTQGSVFGERIMT